MGVQAVLRNIAVDMMPLCVLLLLCVCHQSYISGSPVNVDVGMCRTHCQSQLSSFELGMHSSYSRHSMLDFLKDKKMRMLGAPFRESGPTSDGAQSCGSSSTCEPTGTRVDKVLLLDGLREVEIIEDCHCEAKVMWCLRAPSLKTYFFETPYETVIDVGKCVGSKGELEGFSCVPTKFDSALVDTPNKVELIQTVTACDLKEGCYRIPYVEYHYEITYNEEGLKEEKLKEIDVGRCLGSCTSGNRCLLRSASDSAECLLWAEGQGSACVPQGYESHTFLNQHGQTRTVLAITSCLCQS
ncbi:hypothetical protein AOLI_G00216130 [Acnodon oligacanthus]